MAGTLNTSIFLKAQNKFRERCITLLIDAYYSSISNKSISIDFDENDITAILHNFIDENPKRKSWSISTNTENHLFGKTVTYTKGFAAKFARIDMRFTVFWQNQEYKYFVEAKNIKSDDSGLKRRYIDTGINNFLKGGKYENCAGLLVGYILNDKIDSCVEGVNKLLKKDKRNDLISTKSKFYGFDIHFSSHKEKILTHLFLDYCK